MDYEISRPALQKNLADHGLIFGRYFVSGNKRESYGNSPVTLRRTQHPLKTANFSGGIHAQRQDRAHHQIRDRILCVLDIYEKMMPDPEGSKPPSPLRRVSPNS
jgi:hypothetical protein